jgi:hypothetical protein
MLSFPPSPKSWSSLSEPVMVSLPSPAVTVTDPVNRLASIVLAESPPVSIACSTSEN